MTMLRTMPAAAFVLAWFGPAAAAQGVDPELLMKWQGAPVVHYDIIAEYSRPTEILTGGSFGTWRETAVTDRFELSFNWNPTTATLVGQPVFKNFPSAVSNVFKGACQPPKVDGTCEHLEIVEVKQGYGEVALTAKRVFPGGAVPYFNENRVCGMEAVAPKTSTVTHALTVVPGVFFAMPQNAPKRVRAGEPSSATGVVTIGKDEKTIVVDDTETSGWNYTYTLRIGK